MSKPLYTVIHQDDYGRTDSVRTFKNFFDAQRAFNQSHFRFNLLLVKETRVGSSVVSSEVILRK